MGKIHELLLTSVKSVLLFALLLFCGCAAISRSPEQCTEARYEAEVEKLTDVIESEVSDSEKARSFMLRAETFSAMREYRYAYRDLQVAWKLTCHLYQNGAEAVSEKTPASFDAATACIETIPVLIDKIKPLTSDFAAIMATQEASAIVKKMFPAIPR